MKRSFVTPRLQSGPAYFNALPDPLRTSLFGSTRERKRMHTSITIWRFSVTQAHRRNLHRFFKDIFDRLVFLDRVPELVHFLHKNAIKLVSSPRV